MNTCQDFGWSSFFDWGVINFLSDPQHSLETSWKPLEANHIKLEPSINCCFAFMYLCLYWKRNRFLDFHQLCFFQVDMECFTQGLIPWFSPWNSRRHGVASTRAAWKVVHYQSGILCVSWISKFRNYGAGKRGLYIYILYIYIMLSFL